MSASVSVTHAPKGDTSVPVKPNRPEREARDTLQRFAAGLLLELNSPLGALISSSVTLLRVMERSAEPAGNPRDGEDEIAARKMLRGVTEVADVLQRSRFRVIEIIEDLRSFARLDQADVSTADVRVELDRALAMLSREREHRLRISRHYPPTPLLVASGPERLSYAFHHLLRHALARAPREGRLDVTVESRGRHARILVHLDGAQLEQGPQLGALASRHVIESLGGSLVIESRGRCFAISLPATVVPS